MEIDLRTILGSNPLLLTFTVIGIGYLVGHIRIASIAVGPTAGVLLAGLLFGHLGYPDIGWAGTFGFALFIFSVGLEAGPSFFSVFLADGTRYITLAVVVAVTAVSLAVGLSTLLELDYGLNAGLLAGALTSTPTLAGAEDAVTSGLASLPRGMSPGAARRNISIGYAITYIFGTVGLILFIRYLPRVARIDLPAEARKLARERGLDKALRPLDMGDTLPIIRAYRVSPAMEGNTIEQVVVDTNGNAVALRIRRRGAIIDATPQEKLQAGDVVSFIASLKTHAEREAEIGEEVLDPELLSFIITSKDIVVTDSRSAGKTVQELQFPRHGCFATGVNRAGIELPVEPDTVVQKGDRVRLVGEESRLASLAGTLGYIEEDVEETDLVTFCFGVAAGVLVGLVTVKVMGLSIGLGLAGGLLLSGIAIGFLRSVYPTFGGVPAAARQLLREFGLMLFMAGVGLHAGEGIYAALKSVGPQMVLSGAVVTLVPATVGFLFGRFVFKMNPALLLGSIAGAMTSTPSLQIANEAAGNHVPALGYAGTYTFANVLLTFSGTLIMILF